MAYNSRLAPSQLQAATRRLWQSVRRNPHPTCGATQGRCRRLRVLDPHEAMAPVFRRCPLTPPVHGGSKGSACSPASTSPAERQRTLARSAARAALGCGVRRSEDQEATARHVGRASPGAMAPAAPQSCGVRRSAVLSGKDCDLSWLNGSVGCGPWVMAVLRERQRGCRLFRQLMPANRPGRVCRGGKFSGKAPDRRGARGAGPQSGRNAGRCEPDRSVRGAERRPVNPPAGRSCRPRTCSTRRSARPFRSRRTATGPGRASRVFRRSTSCR